MEENIKIPTSDKKHIYGTLSGSLKNPLIIMVHGLVGFKDEHIHFNSAKFFEKNGFSVFRFNLYGYEKDARKLLDCTLAIHANDLDTVVAYFRKLKVKKIYVIGHSYGGPTIVCSKKRDFDKIVLWDPALEPDDVFRIEIKRLEGTDMFYADWGSSVLLGKKMVQEDKKIKPLELIKNIHVPIKFIFAGEGYLKKRGWDKYFNAANDPKNRVIIPGASHNFHEEGTEEKLFDETVKWIKED